MKRNVIMCVALMASAVVFFGCASTPAAPVASEPAEVVEPVDVVEEESYVAKTLDSKAMAAGVSVPKWFEVSIEGASALKELYPDNEVLLIQVSGKNLEAIKFEAETFAANTELSRRLSTFVSSEAAQAGSSDGSTELKKAAEFLAAVFSKAEFSGLEKESDYWVLREYEDGRIYTYTVFYLMPTHLYNQQIDDMLTELPDEEREILQPILDKAREMVGTAY